MENEILKVVAAISLRNEVDRGIRGPDWVRDEIIRLVEEGFWNDSHIAALTGYARQSVSDLARRRGAQRPAERPAGGTLAPGALDAILELQGAVQRGAEPNRAILQAVVATGTSTRLISRLTHIPIGTVLYAQRKLRREDPHGPHHSLPDPDRHEE